MSLLTENFRWKIKWKDLSAWGRWVLLRTSSTLKPLKTLDLVSPFVLSLWDDWNSLLADISQTWTKFSVTNSPTDNDQNNKTNDTKMNTKHTSENSTHEKSGSFFSIQMCVTVKTQYTLLMFITSLKSMAWSLKIKYYQSNIAKHKARSVFTPHNS